MKTAEEIYDEKVEEYTRGFLTEYLQSDVDNTELQEFLDERNEDDYDLFVDVRESIYNTLDTILQRYLDY